MFYILIALVVGATLFALGLAAGRGRRTVAHKNTDEENGRLIQQNARFAKQNIIYRSALQSIERGSSVPELEASTALKQALEISIDQ